MTPKITVLIPTFNRADYLAECLNSILGQTLPAHQIMVINDGSIDDTQKICQSYGDKIEYYELNQVGKPSALNFGLKKNTGEYLWIFDDDDVAMEDALERFVEPLENDKSYGFSFSSFFYTSTNASNNSIGDIIRESQIPDFDRGFFNALLEANFLGGAALFARSLCYREVGDFDCDLLRSQDYEMAIRIAMKFKGIRISKGATFHYRQHEGMRGANKDRFLAVDIKRKWFHYDQKFFKKFYKTIPLSAYLPPGHTLDNKIRQAILQRMAVMSRRGLFSQVIQDLHLLAEVKDQTPFLKEEYSLVRTIIVDTPCDDPWSIFEYTPFFDEVSRLAKVSHVIRLLRFNLMWAMGARFKNQPRLHEIHKSLNQLAHLHI